MVDVAESPLKKSKQQCPLIHNCKVARIHQASSRGISHEQNEDRILISKNLRLHGVSSPETHLVGVFDGHGGDAASSFLVDHMEATVTTALSSRIDIFPSDLEEISAILRDCLVETFTRLDIELNDYLVNDYLVQGDAGSCAAVALIHGGVGVVANVGDCQVLLGNANEHSGPGNSSPAHFTLRRPLTTIHRSSEASESTRIERAGGFVQNGRAFGILEPSRAFGDLDLKKRPGKGGTSINASPALATFYLAPCSSSSRKAESSSSDLLSDEGELEGDIAHCPFLVVGTDGLFDFTSESEIVESVRTNCLFGGDPCSELVSKAVQKGSPDDISVIVVLFSSQEELYLAKS